MIGFENFSKLAMLYSKNAYVMGEGGQNSKNMATWFVYDP